MATPTSRRQIVLLGALLVVLAAVLWWSLSGAPTAATTARRAAAARTAATPPEPVIETVRLDKLTAGRTEPDDGPRDPFKFRARAAASETNVALAPPPAPPPAPTGPPPPPPPPPIRVKFIGLVDPVANRPLAVLSDGANVFYGQEGDIIEGRWRILKIGTESIELAWVDGRGRQTIRLSGS